MTNIKIEKEIVKLFILYKNPDVFINTFEKEWFHSLVFASCIEFTKKGYVSKDKVNEICKYKNDVYKDIDYSKTDNVLYYDMLRLVIIILTKYSN